MKRVLILLLSLFIITGCNSQKINKEKLVVGMECAYAPFNWTQPNSTNFSEKINDVDYCDGYDIQIARHLAKDLNRELVVKKTSWDALIPAVNNGQIDLIIAGMTKTEDRLKEIDFTDKYYES